MNQRINPVRMLRENFDGPGADAIKYYVQSSPDENNSSMLNTHFKDLATKKDIRMFATKEELKEELGKVRGEMKDEFVKVRAEMKDGFANARMELKKLLRTPSRSPTPKMNSADGCLHS